MYTHTGVCTHTKHICPHNHACTHIHVCTHTKYTCTQICACVRFGLCQDSLTELHALAFPSWSRRDNLVCVYQMCGLPCLPMQKMWHSLGWEDPPVEGNGNPLQYSCLGNPMDRGTWWVTVHGVTKSWTWLGD